jgi:hypothetical protein
MTFTAVRRCLSAVALFSVLALVAACTGSGSTLLSPTGPGASVNRSLATVTNPPPDPCVPTLVRTTGETVPTPTPVLCNGRFTGGGFQIDANELKVTRGFTLHCDELLSNNFEVNWKDANGNAHHFHTDKNPEVSECSKPFLPNPPDAGVSRIVILNQPGKLDGENDPTHLITIVLEDHGEPGTEDRAYIAISGIGALTGGSVASPALIDGGNIQAHFDQPHKN